MTLAAEVAHTTSGHQVGGRCTQERHAGEVPQSFEELEALPGVGHKTASVIMAQCFGYAL